jgi:hypothetical protein
MRDAPHVARTALVAAAILAALTSACSRTSPPEPPLSKESAPRESPRPPAVAASAPPSVAKSLSERLTRPAPERLVAIGDLHGDLDATRRALRLAGAIDDKDAWIGGKLVVVQTGDAIDRGDDDRAILDLFERLKLSAKAAGGEVVALVGNHELMNAALDFRYVTEGGFTTFRQVRSAGPAQEARIGQVEAAAHGRAAAFAPGGSYATMLASRPVVARVGDTVFVHGGILPKHVAYGLDRMDSEIGSWLLGKSEAPPRIVMSEDGPVWTRMYSAAPAREDCQALTEALGALGAKRMVMGHTVQRGGISRACDERAWRIDVGMSKFYGGPIEVLELRGDTVKVLKEGPR